MVGASVITGNSLEGESCGGIKNTVKHNLYGFINKTVMRSSYHYLDLLIDCASAHKHGKFM